MKIRGTLTLRNHCLLLAREQMGFTQKQAAQYCGCSLDAFQHVERLDFSTPAYCKAAELAALAFDLVLDEIMPEAMVGEKVRAKIQKSIDIDAGRLLAQQNPARFILPSPVESAEAAEIAGALRDAIQVRLTDRQRQALTMRYGLDNRPPATLNECAAALGVTRERVRQIILKAEHRLAVHWRNNPLTPFMDDMAENRQD